MRFSTLATMSVVALVALTSAARAQTTFGPSVGGPGILIPDATNNGGPPDDTPGSVSNSIVVGDAGTILSFNSVTIFGLTHTWVGDLVATISNGTTTVDLFNRIGTDLLTPDDFGDDSNLGGDYTFTAGGTTLAAAAAGLGDVPIPSGTFARASTGFAPYDNPATFSNFVGQAIAGNWTLTLTDRSSGDSGQFDSWQFNATVNTVVTGPEPASLALLGLGTLALGAVIRRRAR